MSFQFLSRGIGRFALNNTNVVRQFVPNIMTYPTTRTFASKKVNKSQLPLSFSLSLSFHFFFFFSSNHKNLSFIFFHQFSTQHKNLLKHTKGFRGRSKNCFRIAIRRLQKSWQYSYRDRRRKKREWHKLWIQRISAGVRQYSWRYSEFYNVYRKSDMRMDRKVLAELAANEPFAFRSVLQVVEHQKANISK